MIRLNDIKHYFIYAHINKINHKVYVGETSQKNPEDRWKNGRNYRSNKYFTRAIEKYGWDNFEHIILEEGFYTNDEMAKREQYWIDYYDSMNPSCGYNINPGGYTRVSKEAVSKAIEWMKKHPEFGLEKVKIMLQWQKEHKEEMLEMRRKSAKCASNARKRPVVCIETGIIYESATDASHKVDGTTQSKITMCCKGQRLTCGGYHWKYENE